MKRLLGVCLILCILLCGCVQENTNDSKPIDETTLPATQPTEETVPDLYIPGSALEQATSGAVRCFTIGSGSYGSFTIQNDSVALLYQKDGEGILELYVGNTLTPEKSASLGIGVFPAPEHFCVNEHGIAYYDSVDIAMVFLDHNLRQIARMQMPEEIIGAAWLSPQWKTAYYCKQDGIYILDMQSGISRLLKEYSTQLHEITGLLSDGTVLRCSVESEDGSKHTIFVDALTGTILQETEHQENLTVWNDRYFLIQSENTIRQLRYRIGEKDFVLWPKEDGEFLPLLESDALIVLNRQKKTLALTYYQLDTGLRTAEVTLEGITEAWNFLPDGQGGVWFLAKDANSAEMLCHWNPGKSATDDETSYVTPYFTLENPDSVSLAKWIRRAKLLGEQFGVDIHIWQNAVNLAPAGQKLTAEYMVQVYEKFLPQLEQLLSVFPDGFYEKAAVDKPLKIALVRSITGDPAMGTLPESTSLMYWDGDVPVIVLAMNEELAQSFYHALAHVIDTNVLSKTTAFYEWNTLNPNGFAYDNDYIVNLDRVDSSYAEGDERYFIDLFSMSFAREDRATIFEYSCMEGNEAYFQSPVIQEKLRRICVGIRAAFELKDVEAAFLWEQYLKT